MLLLNLTRVITFFYAMMKELTPPYKIKNEMKFSSLETTNYQFDDSADFFM